ncbi:MAG: class I SAM-dependent rRNA methyltransferase, partial [Nitrospirae bacterium]|nr:class I SAM-dependent rRNA methyltransferase [Nitrospirota bacterium]
MNKVYLKRTSRILAGHLWIFSNELASSPKDFEPGSLVEVCDSRDGFIGTGYINPHSLISVRLLTREKESIGPDFFRRRISDALIYRKRFFTDRDSFRVIFSEGDFLPGLIVDKYAGCISVQFLTLGMEMMKEMILSVLEEILSPSVIVLRNDSQSRTLEGMSLEKKIIKGSLEHLPVIDEDGIKIGVDPLKGQKTGFFLDHRENRIALKKYVKGGRGLDLFCYSGAWGLHLAQNGSSVTGIDESETAIAAAR